MAKIYIVDGYEFNNEDDARAANEELAKVNALHSKIDSDNLTAMKAVYTKAVEQNVFETQIGITYLRNLREYLVSQGTLAPDEKPLPVIYTKNFVIQKNKTLSEEYDVLKQEMKRDFEVKLNAEKKKTEKALLSCKNRTVLCFVLVLMVALMFGITLTAKSPNILNYKTAITNQYSEWEQNLSEREAAVREKEAELGIQSP